MARHSLPAPSSSSAPPTTRRRRRRSSAPSAAVLAILASIAAPSAAHPVATPAPTLSFLLPNVAFPTPAPTPAPARPQAPLVPAPADSPAGGAAKRAIPMKFEETSRGSWLLADCWALHGHTSCQLSPATDISYPDSTVPTPSVPALPQMSSVSTNAATPTKPPTTKPSIDTSTLPQGWLRTNNRTQFYPIPIIVVGSVILAIFIVVTIVTCALWRRKRRRRELDTERAEKANRKRQTDLNDIDNSADDATSVYEPSTTAATTEKSTERGYKGKNIKAWNRATDRWRRGVRSVGRKRRPFVFAEKDRDTKPLVGDAASEANTHDAGDRSGDTTLIESRTTAASILLEHPLADPTDPSSHRAPRPHSPSRTSSAAPSSRPSTPARPLIHHASTSFSTRPSLPSQISTDVSAVPESVTRATGEAARDDSVDSAELPPASPLPPAYQRRRDSYPPSLRPLSRVAQGKQREVDEARFDTRSDTPDQPFPPYSRSSSSSSLRNERLPDHDDEEGSVGRGFTGQVIAAHVATDDKTVLARLHALRSGPEPVVGGSSPEREDDVSGEGANVPEWVDEDAEFVMGLPRASSSSTPLPPSMAHEEDYKHGPRSVGFALSPIPLPSRPVVFASAPWEEDVGESSMTMLDPGMVLGPSAPPLEAEVGAEEGAEGVVGIESASAPPMELSEEDWGEASAPPVMSNDEDDMDDEGAGDTEADTRRSGNTSPQAGSSPASSTLPLPSSSSRADWIVQSTPVIGRPNLPLYEP